MSSGVLALGVPPLVHKAAGGTLSEATLAFSFYCVVIIINMDYHIVDTVSPVSLEKEQRGWLSLGLGVRIPWIVRSTSSATGNPVQF